MLVVAYLRKILIGLGLLLIGSISHSIQLVAPVSAQSNPASKPVTDVHVTAKLIADTSAIAPGNPFHLGVQLFMQPGWHTYYRIPGDAGMATKIDWLLPSGFAAKSQKWEKPTRLDEAGIVSYVYVGTTLIAAEITPPAHLKPQANVLIKAKVKWLSCHDICVPGGSEVELTLPVVASPNSHVKHLHEDAFSRANFDGPVGHPVGESVNATKPGLNSSYLASGQAPAFNGVVHHPNLFSYIALALMGGLILNFMPCVLPVIAIKILSLLEQSDCKPMRVRMLGLAFAAGIISSFLALAGLVIAIQAAGHTIGWGFQFQYPPFVLAMAAIILVFALSLFGQFNISVNVGQNEVQQLSEKEGLTGTFFKGVLATILSTPCTAPFLGTALGFAFSQPWWTVLTIFFSVGLGMSSPYLLMTINPAWMKFLPKPGAWMEKLKEFFGFVLLATVAWLISILGSQVGVAGLVQSIYFLIAVALSVWFMSRFSDLTCTATKTKVVRTIAVTVTGGALYFFILAQPNLFIADNHSKQAESNRDSEGWQPFTLSQLNSSLVSGKTVFLDFTAKWCLTCQVNEAAVLRSQSVQDKFKALHVVLLKADWTNQDKEVSELLRKFGRSGVPLYVIFPGKSPDRPIVLPEIIDIPLVLEKLDEAGPSL